jgi:hypothetical protein
MTSSARVMPSSWTISQISGKVSDFYIFPDLSDPSSSSFPSEKTFPISHIVNSSRVSSVSDPPMSSDFLLVKWRPVSSGGGSWEDHAIIPGGRLLSWLVSLLNEDIMGFIVEGGDLLLVSLLAHSCTLSRFLTLDLSHLLPSTLSLKFPKTFRCWSWDRSLQQDNLHSNNPRLCPWGV